MLDLGTLGGTYGGGARGINDRGQVVGSLKPATSITSMRFCGRPEMECRT